MAVGPVPGADGTIPATGRQAKTGESVVSQAHGKYYEAASRGVLFHASDQGIGAPCSSLTIGATALLSLYNPIGSGKRLSVKRVRVAYFSGTLGGGTLFHCLSGLSVAAIAIPTGTAAVANCCDAGNQSGAVAVGVCKITATVTAPTTGVLGPLCSIGSALATTATFLNYSNEDVDGEFVIEPGSCYMIEGVTGAGTSPRLSVGITWEEIAIVAAQG